MRSLVWAIAIAFFFLNPHLACGSDEPQFQYGAEEMRAAIEGDWTFTITPDGGAAMQVTVHIEQEATTTGATSRRPDSRFVRAAYACGTRTLVKSAAACADLSEMPLTITYVSGDASFSTATMSGNFKVYGLAFASGALELTIGRFLILSRVNADGSLNDPHLGPTGTAGTLTVSRS